MNPLFESPRPTDRAATLGTTRWRWIWNLLMVLLCTPPVFSSPPQGSTLAEGSPLRLQDLRCEDQKNPIGINDRSPEFRFLISGTNGPAEASSYQILVASTAELLATQNGDLWDSGRRDFSEGQEFSYQGPPLTSRQRAYWTARVWDTSGRPSAWAPPQSFELGLLETGDWKAEWIWSSSSRPTDHIYLRRKLSPFSKPIAGIRVYVSASHHYELFLNKHPIGRGPNIGFDTVRYYQSWAIDPALLTDTNNNVITVRAHWIGSGQSRPALDRGLLFQMEVQFVDGSRETILSDGRWETTDAEWYFPLNESSQPKYFRNSEGVPYEAIDARNTPPDLFRGGPAELKSSWIPATLIKSSPSKPNSLSMVGQETSLRYETISPKTFKVIAPGRYLVDFGKVYAGKPIVRLPSAPPGHTVTLRAGYRLDQNGEPPLLEQRSDLSYEFKMAGKPPTEVFEPYWYVGLRYLLIDGTAGPITANDVSLVAQHNAIDIDRSQFHSSSEILNQLWELAVHSLTFGAQEQFIDTPTREQGQFSYDSYLIGTAQAEIFGERLLNRQALREFAASQSRFSPPDGQIDAVAPNGASVQEIADWTLIWPLWAWEYFRASGDTELLHELYPALQRTAAWVGQKISPTTSLIDLGSDPWARSGLIDWPDRYNYDLSTSQRTVINGYGVELFKALSEIAQLNGDKAGAALYLDTSQKIARAIQTRLWDPAQNAFIDGLLPSGARSPHASEQANAMLLALRALASSHIDGAFTRLNPSQPATSVLLSRFLVTAWGEHNRTKDLLTYLTVPNSRNFASILSEGGTFTYESWGGFRSTSGESESHAYGALTIVRALIRYLAGIRCSSPGCATVDIYPALNHVEKLNAQVPTQFGIVSVSWENSRSVTLSIPARTTAHACIPLPTENTYDLTINGKKEPFQRIDEASCMRTGPLASGTYRIEVSSQGRSP